MIKLLKIQGMLFSIISLSTILIWPHLQVINLQSQIVIGSIMILFLGVPHGALDAVLAEKTLNIKSIFDWIFFLLEYCTLAIIIVIISLYLPLIFVIGFLIISIYHFSTDLSLNVPFISRLLYGGAIIFISSINYSDDIILLFSMLSGSDVAELIHYPIKFLSIPWLILLICVAIYQTATDINEAIIIIVLGILSLLVPPLISFTIYFCFMHSLRHIIQSVQITKKFNLKYHIKMIILPMSGVLISTLICRLLLKNQSVDEKIIKIVFLGLAALTVPHMIIVEKVRLKLKHQDGLNDH